jgi:hypothetical protein
MKKKKTHANVGIVHRPSVGAVCFNVSVELAVDEMTKKLSPEEIRAVFQEIAEGIVEVMTK